MLCRIVAYATDLRCRKNRFCSVFCLIRFFTARCFVRTKIDIGRDKVARSKGLRLYVSVFPSIFEIGVTSEPFREPYGGPAFGYLLRERLTGSLKSYMDANEQPGAYARNTSSGSTTFHSSRLS